MLGALDLIDPKHLIETFGTIGLIAIVFVESGLLPAPLPGDSLLFIAGFFASTNSSGKDPHLHLPVLLVGCFVAAVAGAQLGHWIGERYGVRLFKPDARLFKTEYLERSQAFFDRRGPGAVVLGRFIPLLRTIIPILAGASRMSRRSFFVANVIGAAIWAVGVTMLGYFLGKQIGADNIDKYLLPIIAVIVVISLIPVMIEFVRHRRAAKVKAQ